MTAGQTGELPFKASDEQQRRMDTASAWFAQLQCLICDRFEAAEQRFSDPGRAAAVRKETTRRTTEAGGNGGGGVMARIDGGTVFEKAGVNFSVVHGTLAPAAQRSLSSSKELPGLEDDPSFWASGVSVVCHMSNPMVPAVHFNTRMFWTPVRSWFGGGSDLNPCIEIAEDVRHFHAELKACCDRYSTDCHERYRSWADDYFYIRHRKRPRGAGGIFFDDLDSGDWDRDFKFVTDLGSAFLEAWLPIVERRQQESWTEHDRETQLLHRGAYVEFNLLYDRGTRFGLETGHDPDAVLMSLPPIARWK